MVDQTVAMSATPIRILKNRELLAVLELSRSSREFSRPATRSTGMTVAAVCRKAVTEMSLAPLPD